MRFPLSRAYVMAASAVFIGSFHLVYLIYLATVFEYSGFRYGQTSTALLVLSWVIAWLPSLWLPADVYKPTELTYWLLYTTVFVPSVLVPAYVGRLAAPELIPLLFYLAAGFGIVGYFHRLNPLRIRRRAMSPGLFHLTLLLPAFIAFVYLIAKFHSQFQLVSFGNVYAQRATSSAQMASLDQYVSMWLSTGFNPFFMTYGLFRRRPLWLFLGIAGQVLVYALTALKSVLLTTLLYVFVYSSVCKQRTLGLRVAIGSAAILFGSVGLYVAYGSGWSVMLAAVVVMRTFGIPGLCTQHYYEFFSVHPLTYFSHLHGVNLFITYPYSRGVAYEIGDAFYRNPELSANTHFWAQDGLASFGLPGILLMSVLCGLVFWVFDSLGNLAGRQFVTLLLIAMGIEVTNGSLFTMLTSGGGLLLAFYLLFMPVGPRDPARKPERRGEDL